MLKINDMWDGIKGDIQEKIAEPLQRDLASLREKLDTINKEVATIKLNILPALSDRIALLEKPTSEADLVRRQRKKLEEALEKIGEPLVNALTRKHLTLKQNIADLLEICISI